MIFWNRVAERLSGYRSEAVLGSAKVWTWCYPDDSYRLSIQQKGLEIVKSARSSFISPSP